MLTGKTVSGNTFGFVVSFVLPQFKYNGKECVLVSASDILARVSLTTEDRDANPADITPLGDKYV